MDLEGILLSEFSQAEEDLTYVQPFPTKHTR